MVPADTITWKADFYRGYTLSRSPRRARRTYLSGGESHLADPVPLKLNSIGLFGFRIYEYARHVRLEGHVQITPQTDGPDEGFGRAASAPATDGSLKDKVQNLKNR